MTLQETMLELAAAAIGQRGFDHAHTPDIAGKPFFGDNGTGAILIEDFVVALTAAGSDEPKNERLLTIIKAVDDEANTDDACVIGRARLVVTDLSDGERAFLASYVKATRGIVADPQEVYQPVLPQGAPTVPAPPPTITVPPLRLGATPAGAPAPAPAPIRGFGAGAAPVPPPAVAAAPAANNAVAEAAERARQERDLAAAVGIDDAFAALAEGPVVRTSPPPKATIEGPRPQVRTTAIDEHTGSATGHGHGAHGHGTHGHDEHGLRIRWWHVMLAIAVIAGFCGGVSYGVYWVVT